MKKILVLFLVFAMAFTICACSNDTQVTEPLPETTPSEETVNKFVGTEADIINFMKQYLKNKYGLNLTDENFSSISTLISNEEGLEDAPSAEDGSVSHPNMELVMSDIKYGDKTFSCIADLSKMSEEYCYDNYQLSEFSTNLLKFSDVFPITHDFQVVAFYRDKYLSYLDDKYVFNGFVNEKLPEEAWTAVMSEEYSNIAFEIDVFLQNETSIKEIASEKIDALSLVQKVAILNCTDIEMSYDVYNMDSNFISANSNKIIEYYILGTQFANDTTMNGYHKGNAQ